MIEKEPIPEIGRKYHFFDDGKVSMSRHSMAIVTNIIPLNKAKELMFRAKLDEDYNEITTYITPESNVNEYTYEKSLYDIWVNEVSEHVQTDNFKVMNAPDMTTGKPWLYDNETDCFIECSIPDYDDYLIYFARDVNGGWFSLNIQNCWQGGRLDVNGKRYDNLIEACKDLE